MVESREENLTDSLVRRVWQEKSACRLFFEGDQGALLVQNRLLGTILSFRSGKYGQIDEKNREKV
jgi:hypothetical protein